MSPALRVLIADDHIALRNGLRLAIEQGGHTVCAEAGTAGEAIAAALRERPQVCLLDVRMPGGGIHAAHEISTLLPETAVVMLTMSDDVDDLVDAVRAGASGYLLKDMGSAELLAAVCAAASGEAAMSGMLTARLLDEFRRVGPRTTLPTMDGGTVRLTGREWEVVELLSHAQSTGHIAERLFVDRVTVRRHISDVLRKTGATSRDEIVRLVVSGASKAISSRS